VRSSSENSATGSDKRFRSRSLAARRGRSRGHASGGTPTDLPHQRHCARKSNAPSVSLPFSLGSEHALPTRNSSVCVASIWVECTTICTTVSGRILQVQKLHRARHCDAASLAREPDDPARRWISMLLLFARGNTDARARLPRRRRGKVLVGTACRGCREPTA